MAARAAALHSGEDCSLSFAGRQAVARAELQLQLALLLIVLVQQLLHCYFGGDMLALLLLLVESSSVGGTVQRRGHKWWPRMNCQ